MGTWEVWVDRGGTFTDVIAKNPHGELIVEKLLSDAPEQYQDAVVEGINRILTNQDVSIGKLSRVKIGTTVATNALLQRKGEECALIITQGFKDLLKIGYQNRPDLFALEIKKPLPLYRHVVEINERMNSEGHPLQILNEDEVAAQLAELKKNGVQSLSIVFMHAIQNSQHELAVYKIAKKLKFKHIYCSHQCSARNKIVRRGHSTVIEAYLNPILQRYIQQVSAPLKQTELYFMQSNGGLINADNFSGKNSLLSGPAGGVVGAIKTAKKLGFNKIIGFDMGGTSTDVCHYSGHYERRYENDLEGYLIDEPMMNIHTIASGGGSILAYVDGRLQVGPESAGADPGPASYRRGGPLTITDANLMLGKIPVDSLPAIFGDKQPLDLSLVQKLFDELAQKVTPKLSSHQLAQGFIDIAVTNMSHAIKKISIDRGIDLSDYVLNCFGGAAAQHACLIAENLGIKKVLVHRLASVLSAYGIGNADIRLIEQKNIGKPLKKLLPKFIEDLKKTLIKNFPNDIDKKEVQFTVKYQIKYQGSDSVLDLRDENQTIDELIDEFHDKHREYFGFYDKNKQLMIESLIVEAIAYQELVSKINKTSSHQKISKHQFYSKNKMRDVDIIPLGRVLNLRPFN